MSVSRRKRRWCRWCVFPGRSIPADFFVFDLSNILRQNYNLISLREAQTVERLTRTTILLAKVTILFLPVSLATSYFSMQLKDIESIPVQTYWFTFLAVVLVTVTFLVVFEVLSAKYTGLLIYKGFARMALERFKKAQP